MPKESHLEFKVGLFVLLGLVALTIFIFSISDSNLFEKGQMMKVIFGFANGLNKNAPVRVAGVEEGVITDIKLFFDRHESRTKVEVEIRINKDTKIPQDSEVMINQLGLLGEKYVEIIPGTDTQNFFEAGDTMMGKDPIPQNVISDRVMEVADKLDKSIAGLNEIIRDEQNVTSIRETLANLSNMTGSFKDVLADVKAGKGNVGKFFYDDRLYDDLQGFTTDIKENPWKLLYRPKDKR